MKRVRVRNVRRVNASAAGAVPVAAVVGIVVTVGVVVAVAAVIANVIN